jgi:hypothetical protein
MTIIWKGPGCLLINGRQLIKPGERVPELALTAERIEALAALLTIKRPPPVVVAQPPVVVSRPATIEQFVKTTPSASVASSSVAVPVSPLPGSVPVSVAPFGKRGTDRGSKAGPKDR